MAQIGIGPIDLSEAIKVAIIRLCLWSFIAALSVAGITWAVVVINRKRWSLRELMAFVAYWSIVVAIAVASYNS